MPRMLFFRKRAQQGGTAGRKAMIDRDHALPVAQQARLLVAKELSLRDL
jgi:putative transposase